MYGRQLPTVYYFITSYVECACQAPAACIAPKARAPLNAVRLLQIEVLGQNIREMADWYIDVSRSRIHFSPKRDGI
jgi:hypothetical protein